jgi:hypothetical protein
MKKLVLIVIFLLSFNLNSQPTDTKFVLNDFLMLLLENRILDEKINSQREIAKTTCEAYGKSTAAMMGRGHGDLRTLYL